jgi:hypothetical protein
MQGWSDSVALPHLTSPDPSCLKNTVNMPFDYKILTSDSSSNGTDGQWTTVDSVKGNVVAGRGHLVDFTGKSWIKMGISKTAGNSQIDEISVFDASKGLEDSWIFIGTSISGMAFRGNSPTSFSELIATKSAAAFTPCMIRGGIGCIRSSDVVADISKYLANAGNMHFWAIEMGTNDAWGGTNANVTAYKANMQLIIDSCKAHNIEPVIARMIATNPAKTDTKWQINPDFLTAIDDLTSNNKLIAGPDFYNFFLNNPTQLNSDGIHPSAIGAASIQRLWAEKMDTLVYKKTSTVIAIQPIRKLTSFSAFFQNKRIVLKADIPGNACIFSVKGEMLEKIDMAKAGSYTLNNVPGVYLIKFRSAKAVETVKIVKD